MARSDPALSDPGSCEDSIQEFFKEHAIKGKTDTEIVKAPDRDRNFLKEEERKNCGVNRQVEFKNQPMA